MLTNLKMKCKYYTVFLTNKAGYTQSSRANAIMVTESTALHAHNHGLHVAWTTILIVVPFNLWWHCMHALICWVPLHVHGGHAIHARHWIHLGNIIHRLHIVQGLHVIYVWHVVHHHAHIWSHRHVWML